MNKWIGVDLDGTLAVHTNRAGGPIGKPLPDMMRRVKSWLSKGKEVRIFTARADSAVERAKVAKWLKDNGLPALAITNKKDWQMQELWDDRAVRVIRDKGTPCRECVNHTGFTRLTDC